MALYFRTLDDAQACAEAFPELELADGVGSVMSYAPGDELTERSSLHRETSSRTARGTWSPQRFI